MDLLPLRAPGEQAALCCYLYPATSLSLSFYICELKSPLLSSRVVAGAGRLLVAGTWDLTVELRARKVNREGEQACGVGTLRRGCGGSEE